MAKHIVSLEWVKENLNNPNLRLIDCRFDLSNSSAGSLAYTKEHLPGAHYFDLNLDLSSSVQAHGGRHPLPNVEEFVYKLEQAGIDNQVVVVAYDDQGGAMASRLWWLLTYIGHEQVYVMDEGFSRWKAKGYPVTSKLPYEVSCDVYKEMPSSIQNGTEEATMRTAVVALPGSYQVKLQEQMLASMEEVRDSIGKEGTLLIDSREAKRYLGLEEPIDRIAGHIPGAVNYFWKESLNEDGAWKSAMEQQERFKKVDRHAEIIVYCGSGITACPNVLALQEAGFTKVKLYAGSWSDWISYSENPVATGKSQKEG